MNQIKRLSKKKLLAIAVAAGINSSALYADNQWLWDNNVNQIDDRIESVNQSGLAQAFENLDVDNGRLRFAVFSETGAETEYGVYVRFNRIPTAEDVAQIEQSGVNSATMKAYQTIPYVRMILNYTDIEIVSQLPGVERVESIPMMYALNNNANKTSGAVDSGYRRFPTVQGNLNITGKGVVVGILDTGVNDAPDLITGFPGHESFANKFIAGGDFYAGQAELNTSADSSINPIDRGEAASSNHGTHVAGTTLGTGGGSGVFGGVAPDAKLVDGKVLSDAGAGFGSADGVEWAILNKDKYGIQVLNLSLGGLDNSNGEDAGSQAINAAFDAGIISLIAAGNDGETGYVSSPAAADKAITVGALADYNTITREDDTVADFSNEGPRLDDGDADNVDEMKPEIGAPGSGLISADGSLTSDGRQYKSLSGTSMATPHVAGVVALMLEANPNLTPTDIDSILRHTAEHRFDWGKVPATERPFSNIDPNYHPSGGWGQVDAYAAVKEALYLKGEPSSQTQVVRISATADEANQAITLHWTSQRETDLLGYEVSRAPDIGGAPGLFEKITSNLIPGTGQAEIARLNNRNHYSITDSSLQVGKTYWYRIQHTSADAAVGVIQEPDYPVTLGTPQAIAYLDYSITHNAMSNDLLVLLGSGAEPGYAKIVIDGASPQEAIAVSNEEGDSTLGTTRYDFRIPLTTLDGVDELLPPSKMNPWWLTVKEGGYINRSGRVNDFKLTMLDDNGEEVAVYQTTDVRPQQTAEGQTTTLWIPDDPSVVMPGDAPTLIELNPSLGEVNQVIALDIYGAEMLPGSTVSVSGSGVTASNVSYISGSRLAANFAVAADAQVGPRDVTIINPDGLSYTLDNAFTVTNADDNGGGNGGGNDDREVTRIDDADPAIEYLRGWHRKDSVDASNGGFHRRMGNGTQNNHPTVKLDFTGNQVSVLFGTADIGGRADVYIDGEMRGEIDFNGEGTKKAPSFNNAVTFTELANEAHVIELILREGAAFIDGFEIVSGNDSQATNSASASYRTQTTEVSAATVDQIAPYSMSVLVESSVDFLSIEVEQLAATTQLQLIDTNGIVVAESLTDSVTGLSQLEVELQSNGDAYQLVIATPVATEDNIIISTSRSYRVK